MPAGDALVRAAEGLLPRIPQGWYGPISEVAGSIAYAMAPRQRAAVRENLRVIAPSGAIGARQVFANQVRQYLEVFHIPRLDKARLARRIRVEGWEHFEWAYTAEKGVIFGSAHLGPIALVGQYLIARGFQVTIPVEPASTELMHAVNRARGAQGFRLVPIDSAFSVHRALRKGGVLGLLADRAVTGVGERVTFFGRETLMPSAHVALALHLSVPLLPAFGWREDGVLVARIHEPLVLRSTGDRERDVRDGVQRFAAILEGHVRAHPEQWTVFERMWPGGRGT